MRYTVRMLKSKRPAESEMYRAMVARDASYEGVFIVGVLTTGIFCRPGCPARTPRRENVEFLENAREALAAGYRPCLRCRPLEPAGEAPNWLRELLSDVEEDPSRRWRDRDLMERGLDPSRVRRWFQREHKMTFLAYLRARRLGLALGRIKLGDDLTDTAFGHGYESESGFREAFDKFFGSTPGQSRARGLIHITRLASPLGPLVAGATDEGICLLEFTDRRMLEKQIGTLGRRLKCAVVPGSNAQLDRLQAQLAEYFAGKRNEFDLPLLAPGTEFQERVWTELMSIPAGETSSYRELAVKLGKPGAQRAVGRANGENRIAILIPCHRVIRDDGTLGGYGGGLWRKRFLIDLERH